MQTECTADALTFQAVGGRAVRARFDGGALTSDGGALLLREVERATGILRRLELTRFRGRLTRPNFGAEVAHDIETESRSNRSSRTA